MINWNIQLTLELTDEEWKGLATALLGKPVDSKKKFYKSVKTEFLQIKQRGFIYP